MKHIYWVGIKESEIQMCSHLFEGSITFIGSGKCGNISFSASHDYIINYNEDSLELDNFMRESLHTIIEKVPDVESENMGGTENDSRRRRSFIRSRKNPVLQQLRSGDSHALPRPGRILSGYAKL
ncbi:MAG: hypothetical protein HFI53_14165 [Lachnospiraceae bacterium]|nr:hypothetical protein [Lachnospiraceae bacterium]